MEPPVPGCHRQSLFLQNFQEVSEGLNDVSSSNSSGPGHKIRVDEALRIEEGQDHLFLPSGVDLGLDRAWCSFHNLLL